jgi:hypothetical protein
MPNHEMRQEIYVVHSREMANADDHTSQQNRARTPVPRKPPRAAVEQKKIK